MAKAKQTTSRRRRGNVTSVNFKDVEAGGGSVPDGRYVAKLLEVEEKEGQESGEPYLECTWEITSRKCQGRKIKYDNYSLQPQALWRLKTMLEALGEEVPDGTMEIDWDQVIKDEEELILDVVAKEGNRDDGQKFARVVGTYPLSDGNTVDDEDDDPKDRRTSGDRSRGGSGSRDRDRNADRDEERGSRSRRDDRDEDRDEDRRGSRSRRDEADDEPEDDRRGSRGRRDEEDDERGSRRSSGSKKLKRGATVEFRDEKKKLREGEVEEIDGDKVTVIVGNDTYEMDVEDVTVI